MPFLNDTPCGHEVDVSCIRDGSLADEAQTPLRMQLPKVFDWSFPRDTRPEDVNLPEECVFSHDVPNIDWN